MAVSTRIADLQRQLAERTALTPQFRERITETYRPLEQLPLLAAEETPAYRPVRRSLGEGGRPAPRR
ncbi:MAG: hypothetical protein AB7N91_07710 [Candidatus Tectimicrobiota bacterium]